nr:putative late blight resistance protein homolog R1A-10 [Ipomoea batatas]
MLQSTSRNSQATDCHQSSRTTNNISSSIVDTSQPEYEVKATHFNKSQHQPLAQEAGTKKCLKRKEPDYYSDEGWVPRFIDPGDENIKEGENDCEDIVRYAGPVVYPKPFMPANEFYWLLGVDSRDLNGEAFAQNVIIQGEIKAKTQMAYAAVTSLKGTLHLHFLQSQPRLPLKCKQEILNSLHENLCFLQEILEKSEIAYNNSATKDLEAEMRDVAFKAEERIEMELSNLAYTFSQAV